MGSETTGTTGAEGAGSAAGTPASPTAPDTSAQAEGKGEPMSPMWVRILGYFHVLLAILLLVLLVKVWPGSIPLAASDERIIWLLFGWVHFEMSAELQMLFVVMVAGALGSYVYAATSFVYHTGQRDAEASWRWWYVLRPFIGIALALGFYFVLRAGFFAASAGPTSLNVVGFAGTAFLVGLFSRQAVEKLGEVFDTLFRVRPKDEPQKDTQHPPKDSVKPPVPKQ